MPAWAESPFSCLALNQTIIHSIWFNKYHYISSTTKRLFFKHLTYVSVLEGKDVVDTF